MNFLSLFHPTLETCQKLKASGFPQETSFRWFKTRSQTTPTFSYHVDWWQMDYLCEEECAAPILGETLEQLWETHWEDTFTQKTWEKALFMMITGYNPVEAAALLYLKLRGQS